ncbi:hypothetical protein LNQ82_08480 [Conchiformibius steedae DSM 2580]|uniref:Uncharacterized protein n=1 Tax=Conchiformibius steedae DSM 2580 TaxID=1121352 RepID=A0AAE9HSD2_9NEIS|nr:hypothetical protein [Conchiformibius steedae]QMT34432.1 hypothetical protein H3L98_05575 [Conchiformibius steedae]URD67214.1 hypothetical protein LNQ82_08480 [Conchiformibius steedae DSM 2580]
MNDELLIKLEELLENTAKKINRKQFNNEPNYTAAFFGKLSGEKIEFDEQYIKFQFSVSNDRGRSSAESHTGIDIGMVFKWHDAAGTFEKAVLVQAKNNVLKLQRDRDLECQCKKMSDITEHYVVMDCPYDCSIPKVYFSKSNEPPFWDVNKSVDLFNYLKDYVFKCTQGDISDKVIQGAKDSTRQLLIETNIPKPTLTKKEKSS